MEIYRIGARIKEERVRQKLSQEDLCYGICAVSTLSRIETGIQKPSLKVEEALLERLGCSTENLVFARTRITKIKIIKIMRRTVDFYVNHSWSKVKW